MIRLLESKDAFAKFIESYSSGVQTVGDIVVGFPNPNEVREINASLTIVGNIIVVGNGQLRFNNVETKLQGNILILNNGKLEVNGGMLTVSQFFLYEHFAVLANKAALTFRGAGIRFSGFNFSCGLSDTAVLQLDQSSFSQGIMTTTVMRRASVSCVGSTNAGEFLFFDQSRGFFANTDGVLTWFVAPPQSDLDMTFPSNTINGNYVFPDSARRAIGIQSRVTYSTCFNTLWGLLTHTDSKVRVTNSNLLVCGARFIGSDTVNVSGLVNRTHYDSFQYPGGDRDVQFTNTTITVWNLYPGEQTNVQVQNSIFGEILSQNKSTVVVSNSICDGTGGFVGSMDTSRMTIVQSQTLSEINARNNSFLLMILSNAASGALHASENAVLGLLNTSYSALPTVGPESASLIGSVDEPSSGFIGQKLKVYGTAKIIAGVNVPVYLSTFWLEYASAGDPDNFYPITNPSARERYRDTLGTWDTKGLRAGEYILRLNMRINIGTNQFDTIHIDRSVRLIDAPVAVTNDNTPENFSLEQNYPNPFSSSTTIQFHVGTQLAECCGHAVSLRVFDIHGREVARLMEGVVEPGEHTVSFKPVGLASGVYMYRLHLNGETRTKLMTLLP